MTFCSSTTVIITIELNETDGDKLHKSSHGGEETTSYTICLFFNNWLFFLARLFSNLFNYWWFFLTTWTSPLFASRFHCHLAINFRLKSNKNLEFYLFWWDFFILISWLNLLLNRFFTYHKSSQQIWNHLFQKIFFCCWCISFLVLSHF